MLKAIQMLGSSSGIVSHRLKPHGNCGLSLVSVSSKPSPSSPTRPPMATSLMMPDFSLLKRRNFIPARMSCTRSESNPDAASSSASSSSSSPVRFQSTGTTRKINFCQSCGGPMKHEIPDGEEKLRAICTLCGKIAYENPKMDSSSWLHGDWRVCCRRSNQRNMGRSYCRCGSAISFCSIGHPSYRPSPESSDCRLFSLEEIPFNALAFSSMFVTLNLYIEDKKVGGPKFHYGTIMKRPGSSPSDIHTFTLDYHLCS
ncbi:nudix hydrolase 23, chloroplastic isoform X2 [Diospyros lotus]|uniref:nudix hydrolase 23, chloroplastic isoform X2 n=1 Tax=Diospyros lotus TaxID=55363 RepID=UPI00225C3A83|nr:nudix hydrolase 23, chloroplastic isoform X2 [Diospyros lotus]